MYDCDSDCDSCKLETFLNVNWHNKLYHEFNKPYFKSIITKLHTTKIIYPPLKQIFAFAAHFNIEEIKIVILGQDPYHKYKQANGLAFSVERGCKIPPSLMNIFRELHIKKWVSGDLTPWAKQGVLLLNNCLTVYAGEPNSHKDFGWCKFVDAILKVINHECKNIVFMLWGQNAWEKEILINKERHLILKSVHPRSIHAHKKFIGCNHFILANAYLKENNKEPINWTL